MSNIRRKGDLWLAVGDETGDWDNNPNSDDNFLGVALVIATVKDWQKALNEKIDNQKISERMKKHHVMKVMGNLPTGDCSLDKPDEKNPVQIKTFKNLRWLAEHNSLITIGAYAKREFIWNKIHRGNSHAQALGQAYGLLLSLIMPFLNNNDELFFIPSLFSSDSKSLPSEQAEIIEEQNMQNSLGTQLQQLMKRSQGHIETTIVSALHETRKNVENWQGLSINLDGGTFSYFQNKHPKAPAQILIQDPKKNPMYNIADMGAALMTLSKNTEKPTHLVDPNKTWQNVNFFKFEELYEVN